MKKSLIAVLSTMAILWLPTAGPAANQNPRVRLETSKGAIVLELFADRAPETVANFLGYVDAGFYDGTIFHRVIADFMIQGGGLTADMKPKATRAPVTNEAGNGPANLRGTIAMARTSEPHSATAQFFINTVDNDFLNHQGKTAQGWGYAVFGQVVAGMGVVDAIARVPTVARGGLRDVPAEPIVILSARRVKE